MMILRIAWKNIWRNKVRSLVLILSTVIGVWSLIFLLGWMFGMINSFISKTIDYRLGHIQIHHNEFGQEFKTEESFSIDRVRESLDEIENIKWSERLIVQSMLQSSSTNRAIILKGVHPVKEDVLTNFSTIIKKGNWLEYGSDSTIVISEKIAEQLNVDVGGQLTARFQTVKNRMVASKFTVKGIFESGDIKLDQINAFVNIDQLRSLIAIEPGRTHEVVLKLDDLNDLASQQSSIKRKLPEYSIENYKELSPDINLFSSQIKINVVVMTVIFMLALIFGIINTMLMAVMERVREIGMLMAIGMNKLRVSGMIVLETVIVTIIGVPIGLLLAHITIDQLQINGVDLSNWSEGLQQFGLPQIVRPELSTEYYIFVACAVAITSVLASIYPARKAVKLKPVEALRKI